jgi:uncharacterized protein YcbX
VPVTVESLWRFPVKGLRGEPLPAVDLVAGQGVPHDRRFAIVRGDTSFDPARPSWLPPKRYVMLKKDTALGRLAGGVDFAAGTGALVDGDVASCVAPFATVDGLARLDGFVNQVLGPRPEGPAHLVEAGELSFTDVPENGLSLINLASVRELETRMGRPLHPLRFRANVYLAGAEAWEEFRWLGELVRLGDVTVRVTARIPRCPATGVNPESGARDLNVVQALRETYGHKDMGVYATVVRGGRLAVGAAVRSPEDARAGSRLADHVRFAGFIARNAMIMLRRARQRGR